jgi:selenide,water dikinase
MIDDPYLFGRIAAHHSLNDIYAMAAVPTAALAFVTLPFMAARMMEEELFQVLSGAVSVLNEANVPLVGGHSAEGAELSIALTITGNGSEQPLTKGNACSGDAVILTKALGTGVLLAAAMRGEDDAQGLTACIASMNQSNATAVDILQNHGVHALTDVTGFGLLGHLGEMLRASDLGSELHLSHVPFLPGATAAFSSGVRSSLHGANEQALLDFKVSEAVATDPRLSALVDPQTSGGLLAAVPSDKASQCIAALHEAGFLAASVVGEFCEASRLEIRQ